MLLMLAACTTVEPAPLMETGDDGTFSSSITKDTSPPDEQEEEDPLDTAETGLEEEEEDPRPTFEDCFAQIGGGTGGPDYAPFEPVIGTHCSGTDHQDIQGVQRVVFLGDSVTVGTPPTDATGWYRNLLADRLADRYGLEKPGWFWQNANLVDGTVYSPHDGAFSSCAKWGARADDLMRDNSQVQDCFPEDRRSETTLVVMTIGGNDLSSLTSGFIEGKSHSELWDQSTEAMGLVREAVTWIKEPGRFPNGVFVVFTNLYEFTDATGDTGSCPAANLAGFGEAVTDPALEEMVVWSMEEFMSIAVDTDSDMLFLLESFCGHGFNYDDPNGRCYRGNEAELWFDLTCIHPNDAGHAAMAEMFMSVIEE